MSGAESRFNAGVMSGNRKAAVAAQGSDQQ
jgi:hypothetical protein